MKPLKLEIQAFGPYVEKQTVDFEALSKKGMFLIKGNTGSGKTTIFDAMTFALYGGGSGGADNNKGGRNDLAEWRCTQAPDELETFVSFTFSSHGKKYVFTRRYAKKRTNYSESYGGGEIDGDGNVVPFFENPKQADLTNKAVELVGLTKDQFRQVVLLPQGQFERFLTASSGEKEEILEKIFSVEKWKRYADKFFENASERKAALENERDEVKASLDEEGLADLDALRNKIEDLKNETAENLKSHKDFSGDKKQEELNRDRALAENFKPLHEFENKMNELGSQKAEFDEKKEKYQKAQEAETCRSAIAEWEKAKEELSEREKALALLKEELSGAALAKENAEKAKTEHAKNSPEEKLTADMGAYEAKRPVYENLRKLKSDYTSAKGEYDKAKTDSDRVNGEYERVLKAASEKKTAFEEADETAREYRDKYYAGIYGEIAGTLCDGEKCPVCGSESHPEPAKKAPDSVSKDDVDTSQMRADSAKNMWNDAEKLRAETENRKTSATKMLAEKDKALGSADAALKSAKGSLIDGIEDIDALDKAIADLGKQREAYKAETEKLQSEYTAASEKLNELSGKISSSEDERKKAETALENSESDMEKLLKEHGYKDCDEAKKLMLEPSEQTKLHEETVGYETTCKDTAKALEQKKEELKGKTEPDSSAFDQRQKEIDDEKSSFSGKDTKLKAETERLTKKLGKLEKKFDHYSSEIVEAESDYKFAKKLRGDSGVGIQRYVLAVMFSQVIGEANRMLEKVHGGRYRLFRSNDKANGNKRGLELKVHDSRSPEKEGRGVSMLSGGEKFLVSLALSIGMSTVAQKSGVQIEALFIDEGFGTLDEKSINDAMDILDSVRRTSGMIGIISHVKLLEDNIPNHLEVVKEDKGSSIKAV